MRIPKLPKYSDFGHFEKICVYFVRASLWVPCQTNLRLIKAKSLWRLPLTVSFIFVTCTKRSAPNKDHITFALRHVGNGHTKSPRRIQIFTSFHQLLHQMDWGNVDMRNLNQQGIAIHLETPHMQVWPPLHHCHRQWYLIQSSCLWRILNEDRCHAPRNICRTPPNQ